MYKTNNSHKTGDIIGASNEKKLGLAYIGVQKSGLENLHGALDLIF